MDRGLVAFGDVHLQWQSMRVILDHAREHGIDTALTLGDEGYTFGPSAPSDYELMWNELRTYRDEKAGRELICCIGDHTSYPAKDLLPHFVGAKESATRGKKAVVYQDGSVLAAHNGQWILDLHRGKIEGYGGLEPLVIFHGHSHSLGVLPDYRWLRDDELVYWLRAGEEQHSLEPGKVYWVNPGSQIQRVDDGRMAANFALYNPKERLVTLRTILYNDDDISPSRARHRR